MKFNQGEFENDWYSECGEYNIAFYPMAPCGKFYAAYKKDTFTHYGTKKKYRAFGNSFVYNQNGENKFLTFDECLQAVNNYNPEVVS
jgi:hypothetical protein